MLMSCALATPGVRISRGCETHLVKAPSRRVGFTTPWRRTNKCRTDAQVAILPESTLLSDTESER
jgi:hypothetical protein